MNINLNPLIWGPHGWFFLESIIISYPNNPTTEDKNNYKNFFTYLKHVLPCEKCRYNYSRHLKNNPLNDKVLLNKDTFFNWIINIHNLSNGYNKYKSKSSINYYNMIYSNNNNNYNYYNMIIIIIIIILLIIYMTYKKKIYNV